MLLGSAIGFERQWHQKMAGLRTNALVALGASGFVAFSGMVGAGDPTRVAAQVVTGIGFLGAGVILRGQGARVYHLTTAASLWVTTGVGVLCGLGEWKLAVVATALVLLVLVIGLRLDRWLYGISGVQDDDRE